MRRLLPLALLVGFVILSTGCSRNATRVAETRAAADRLLRSSAEGVLPGRPQEPIPSAYQTMAEQIEALPDAERHHYVNVLEIGEEALLARLHMIRSARRSIDIQTFIWHADDVGGLLICELVAAARRGVRVRVLLDRITPIEDPNRAAQIAVVDPDLHVKLYNPPKTSSESSIWRLGLEVAVNFRRFNSRMHNKLMVVDDRIGITGGRNIGAEYFDWHETYNYRDRDILVVGPAVGEMAESFQAYWDYSRSIDLLDIRDIQEELRDPHFAPAWFWSRPYPPDLMALVDQACDPEQVSRVLVDRAMAVAGSVSYRSDPPDKRILGFWRLGKTTAQELADMIRDKLKELGVELQDTSEGATWKFS